MYIPYNPNPAGRKTDDCVIRAVAKALGYSWEKAYDHIAREGRRKCDMPNANHIWIGYLKECGFRISVIRNTCPDCYTVKEFCTDNPRGLFVLGDGNHVVTAIDGDWYDTWDSGDLVPTFYLWR